MLSGASGCIFRDGELPVPPAAVFWHKPAASSAGRTGPGAARGRCERAALDGTGLALGSPGLKGGLCSRPGGIGPRALSRLILPQSCAPDQKGPYSSPASTLGCTESNSGYSRLNCLLYFLLTFISDQTLSLIHI